MKPSPATLFGKKDHHMSKELWIVIFLVVLSAGFIAWRLYRLLKGGGSSGCGCESCGCHAKIEKPGKK